MNNLLWNAAPNTRTDAFYNALGMIPFMVSQDDPRPAKEQFNDNYSHGGGWRPFKGFKFDPDNNRISYPGDPPYEAVAIAKLRDEVIIVYPHAWVLILQKDGSFEISRMD